MLLVFFILRPLPHVFQGTIDAVLVSAHLVLALHSIVPRNVSPLDSAVVTVCDEALIVRLAFARTYLC